MGDGMNVGRKRPSSPIPGIVGKAATAAKDAAKKAAKTAKGIHSEVAEKTRPPSPGQPRPSSGAPLPKGSTDPALAAELAQKRLAGHLGAAKAVEGSTAKASAMDIGDMAGAIGDAVKGRLEDLEPKQEKNYIRLHSGPWVKIETAADDESPEAHRNRIGDAAKPGKTLIGVELGLQRFLDANLEASGKFGRAYLSGAIDFGKLQGTIFADGSLIGVDFSFGDGLKIDRPAIGGMLGGQVLGELVGAHYEVGYDTPTVTMLGREVGLQFTARLDAAVHAFARGWVEASVGMRNAIGIGGQVFAGASATLSGQAALAPFADVHGSVTGWAGVGAKFVFGVEADFGTGEFGLKQSSGVAVGVGGSYDWGVSVNVIEVAKFAYDHGRFLENPQGHLEETMGDFGDIVGDFCEAMSGGGLIGARALGLALEVGGDAVAAGSDVVGAAVSSGGSPSAVGDAMGKASGDVANSVGDAAAKVFGWFSG